MATITSDLLMAYDLQVLLIAFFASIIILASSVVAKFLMRRKEFLPSLPLLLVVASYLVILIDIFVHEAVDHGYPIDVSLREQIHFASHSISAILFIIGAYFLLTNGHNNNQNETVPKKIVSKKVASKKIRKVRR